MAGEPQTYFLVEQGDRFYVSKDVWAYKAHRGSFVDEETAQRIQRRYPGSRISRNVGYDVSFKSFEELEPDSSFLLEEAIRLSKADGHSKEHVLMVAERTYNAH